jgi:hypothetical protein
MTDNKGYGKRQKAGGKRSASEANLSPIAPAPARRQNLTHGLLANMYHVGGRVESDTPTMAAARDQQAAIQRRHRLERRHDEVPSQTPALSQLIAGQQATNEVGQPAPGPGRRGRSLKAEEIVGRNAYKAFERSVFLTTIQRQHGEEDQALFRAALRELKRANVSIPSWELLTSRCAVKLTAAEEVDTFANALSIYPTKAQVNTYNHDHMVDLDSAVIQVNASHQGRGAEKAESRDAGNLSKSFPICVGCRVMLTRNLWCDAGLVNGAQGTVYDISWAEGSETNEDPPQVIMVGFDKYNGPPFDAEGQILRDADGKLVVPILRVRQDFVFKGNTCYREQFPLIISYAITVHKSQGVTLDKVVCDISMPEFASGLSYVAVSRVSKLEGLMFEAPFDRSRVYREEPILSMQMKMSDYESRKLRALCEPLYELAHDEYSSDEDEGRYGYVEC